MGRKSSGGGKGGSTGKGAAGGQGGGKLAHVTPAEIDDRSRHLNNQNDRFYRNRGLLGRSAAAKKS